MSEKVDLNAVEIQAVNRYQAAIAESQRDIQKATEATNTLLSIVWVRAGGDPSQAFRLNEDRRSLISVQE